MYKLYRENITNWTSIENSGIPNFKFSNSIPNGYVLYDSILEIFSAIEYCKILIIDSTEYYCDYKFIRDRIKDKLTSWNNHSTQEKSIFCQLKIGTELERVGFLESIYSTQGFITHQKMMINYAYQTTAVSRTNRAKFVFNEIWCRLNMHDAKVLALKGTESIIAYTTLGFDGTINDDPEGVYDFIYGIAGTKYENDGILQQTLITEPIGYTQLEFCNHLFNLTIKGEYLNLQLAQLMGLI